MVLYIIMFCLVFFVCFKDTVEYQEVEPVTWGDLFTCFFLAIIAPVSIVMFMLWLIMESISNDTKKRN